jgi:hypothetical protein
MNKLKFFVVLFSMFFPVYVGSLILSTATELRKDHLQTLSIYQNEN